MSKTQNLPYRVEWQNNYIPYFSGPKAIVLDDAIEWEKFFVVLNRHIQPPPLKPHFYPDFKKEYLVLISTGTRPTSGYQLKVKGVKKKKETILITLEEICPKEGEITLPVLTHPFIAITIPKLGKKLEVKISSCEGKISLIPEKP